MVYIRTFTMYDFLSIWLLKKKTAFACRFTAELVCFQVSRMLPGGLSVLGVFIITDSDAKDTITTLRQVRVIKRLCTRKCFTHV